MDTILTFGQLGQLGHEAFLVPETRITRTQRIFPPKMPFFLLYLGHNSVSFFLNFFFKGYLKCIKMHFVFHQTWVREGSLFSLFGPRHHKKQRSLFSLFYRSVSCHSLSLTANYGHGAGGGVSSCHSFILLYFMYTKKVFWTYSASGFAALGSAAPTILNCICFLTANCYLYLLFLRPFPPVSGIGLLRLFSVQYNYLVQFPFSPRCQ